VQALWKLKLKLSSDAAPLGIYLKECKTGYNRDTCIYMFIAALFTKAMELV
jgi:hypothetical protein